MDEGKVLAHFNDELRTIYLNVVYYKRRENTYRTGALICDAIIAILICSGLMLLWADKSLPAILVQLLAAVIAFVRLYDGLRNRASEYAFMRGKYYCLFAEAKDLHARYVSGAVSAEKLIRGRNRLVGERKKLSEREDVASSRKVRKLQKEVNAYLPVESLWPSHLWPKEE